ncbi:efflux RND transporter periplasmic adaptor subunit [Desulfurobacterium atlanticum]|uniref:RND family efflux transporter, MFP subunit n=1 Tax=Desulfurobacterium atlanticum TaxID=240169 RepID=A0A238ZKM8_9BACT|nr:biotin/lipoyl-binding protein [Desulfurobacterium atlanticum]SNR83860.1 RND family efflux transporter, MFP subunit [Desulfurobacterium atlanticum]
MKKVITIIVLLVVIFAGVKLVKKRKAEIEKLSVPTIPQITVKTITPQRGKVVSSAIFTGKAEYKDKVFVATKLSGYIQKVYVSEGENINKGQILATIDSKEIISGINQLEKNKEAIKKAIESLELGLKAANVELKFAKDRYTRIKTLYEAGGASKEQLEAAETELNLKKIKVKTAVKNIEAKEKELESVEEVIKGKKSLLQYTTITSPVNGVVGTVFVKNGNLAVPGKPIMTILSGKPKVTFLFPDKNLIKPGMKVEIKEYGRGKITKIYPETKNGLFIAEVKPEKNIPDGALLTLKVLIKEAEGTVIPLNALIETDNGTFVVVKTDKGFEKKRVNVIATDISKAVISPGITSPIAIGSESKLLRLIAGGER